MTTKLSGHEAVAEILRKRYDFGIVETPAPLHQAHQRRHRKLTVETSAGKFMVKTYKRDPSVLDTLRFQHRLSDHLHDNGLPVARIQRARDGKGIVEVDDWALEVQEFIEGAPMEVNTRTLTTAVETLGRFHQVCREMVYPPRTSRLWRFSEVPRATFERLFDLARQADAAAAAKYCDAIVAFLGQAAKELDAEVRDRFETGLIHGDWHGGNLLFRGDQLTAIVDLEFAGDGCYLEDLAYAASNLCIRTTNNEERLAHRIDLLLERYQKYRTLSCYEAVALPYAVGVKHITTVCHQLHQLGGTLSGHSPLEWMRRMAGQCVWLAQQSYKTRWRKW